MSTQLIQRRWLPAPMVWIPLLYLGVSVFTYGAAAAHEASDGPVCEQLLRRDCPTAERQLKDWDYCWSLKRRVEDRESPTNGMDLFAASVVWPYYWSRRLQEPTS